jgi:predicted neutral ceramidase superfamily lipid hydrolase
MVKMTECPLCAANKRELLFIGVATIDMFLLLFCMIVFSISYPTALMQTEPYETIHYLQCNLIMQVMFVVTFAFAVIMVVYDHFSKNPIMGGKQAV